MVRNASCWDAVRPDLIAAGHSLLTPELPDNQPEWSASKFSESIAKQIPSEAGIVIVGHSASGMFLPLIAARRKVEAMVYLAAAIPRPGLSLLEQATAMPEMFNPAWVEAGPRWRDPQNWQTLAAEFLFHDLSEEKMSWAQSTIRPMRIDGAVRERFPASFSVNPVPSTCIVCAMDRTVNPIWQQKSWTALMGTAPLMLSAGHCPQVSVPRETAFAILSAVR